MSHQTAPHPPLQAALPPCVWQHNLHPFERELYIYIFINSRGLGFFTIFFYWLYTIRKKTQLLATKIEAAVPAFC
jgi:hypothetical protein